MITQGAIIVNKLPTINNLTDILTKTPVQVQEFAWTRWTFATGHQKIHFYTVRLIKFKTRWRLVNSRLLLVHITNGWPLFNNLRLFLSASHPIAQAEGWCPLLLPQSMKS